MYDNAAENNKGAKGNRTKIVIDLLKISISLTLIILLLSNIGLASIRRQIADADWRYVLLACMTFIISNIMGALQWHLLMKSQNMAIPFKYSLSFYHIGLFFNNFLIGYIGGDALRIYDVRRYSGDGAAAVTTVLFDRFIGFLTLTTTAMIVSLLWIGNLKSLNAVYSIAIILFIWLVALFFLFNNKAGFWLGRLFRPLLPGRIVAKVEEIYCSINNLRHSRMMLVQVIFISIFVQLLRIVTHYWTAISIGAKTHVLYFFIFVPIIALLASLPISFGGVGVREQSGVALFTTVGLGASQIATFEFLAYLVGIFATLPGGILFILRKEGKGAAS
ncbi:MAG: UPF0104 family protein [Calditrichaeota bacterium]|nr:MAG: UPF0104 family protein [Calditrichota bacterium]